MISQQKRKRSSIEQFSLIQGEDVKPLRDRKIKQLLDNQVFLEEGSCVIGPPSFGTLFPCRKPE